jgi:group I intron endonuclease
MIIYKITNIINGRVYIGQTVMTLARRWSQHSTSKKNSPMYNAFRKYGREAFTIEAICSALSPEHLNELEQYFIKKYDCLVPKGYNLTSGGDSAFTRSQETKDQQRDSMLGHTVSEETRAKISATLMGRPGVRKGMTHTDEAKAKISAAQTGRKLSEATKAKMSAAHKARLAGKDRTPAQLEALKKVHEACKGRVPWNKGLKKS